SLRNRVPDLLVSFDPSTGVARSVWNAVGYLTGEDPAGPGTGNPGGSSPLDQLPTSGSPGPGMTAAGVAVGEEGLAEALDFVRDNLDLFGLSPSDLGEYEVTDSVYSKVSDSTHTYLRQLYREIPVYNGQLQLNVGRGGRLLSVNNAFVAFLASSVNTTEPALTAGQAVEQAAR
ncbi:MAG: hypothetical protein KDD47_09235, partial [Acidobacteria bacterium]|nr:hypothetical protein [Acidobacteriota bacterium]